MTHIFVTDRGGKEIAIEIRPGTSLMQAITDDGVNDLLALCGGMCSCATCHVYITSETHAPLSAMSEDERALLDVSAHQRNNSRLACQVRMHEQLTGLRVQIAPAD